MFIFHSFMLEIYFSALRRLRFGVTTNQYSLNICSSFFWRAVERVTTAGCDLLLFSDRSNPAPGPASRSHSAKQKYHSESVPPSFEVSVATISLAHPAGHWGGSHPPHTHTHTYLRGLSNHSASIFFHFQEWFSIP